MNGKRCLFIAVSLAVLSVFVFSGCTKKTGSGNTGLLRADILNPGEALKIPVNNITTDFSFYAAMADNTYIEILAVKTLSNKLIIAFNTCESCYKSGKGYYVPEDDWLICQNCDMFFNRDEMDVHVDDCHPLIISENNFFNDGFYISIFYEYMAENKHWFYNWKPEIKR